MRTGRGWESRNSQLPDCPVDAQNHLARQDAREVAGCRCHAASDYDDCNRDDATGVCERPRKVLLGSGKVIDIGDNNSRAGRCGTAYQAALDAVRVACPGACARRHKPGKAAFDNA